MHAERRTRAMIGAVCLVAVALVMGWFVGRYIPGEPRKPEPPLGEGLYSETGYVASEIVDIAPGTTVKLRGITQGMAYAGRPDEVARTIAPEVAESWKESGEWEYDIPDFTLSVRDVRVIPTESFADWYPEYKDINRPVYESSKLIAVTATFTNASSATLNFQHYSFMRAVSLWGESLAGIDDSLGAGARLDDAYFFANETFRNQSALLEPGESRDIVLPFKVNKNNLKDPSAFDDLDPTDFCIQVVDYAPETAYRLWL